MAGRGVSRQTGIPIKVEVTGAQALQKSLGRFPHELAGQVATRLEQYFRRALPQMYPNYKYVSRQSAYGRTFFTDRQRKWFFAALNSGELQLPYRRSKELGQSFKVTRMGDNGLSISNTAPYARYVIGDVTQSRHAAKIGWKTLSAWVQSKTAEINARIKEAVETAKRRSGLS